MKKDANNLKIVLIVAALALGFGIFVYLWSPTLGSESFVCEGTYVESTFREAQKLRTKEEKPIESMVFKMNDGKTIIRERTPDSPTLLPGQKVRFKCQKGKFFENTIYSDLELI